MPPPALSASAVRYLFAASWAPQDPSNWSLRVPDALVVGPDTAASLLNLAIWSLLDEGLCEAEQLRPLERERVGGFMGGHSFARVTLLDAHSRRPGLEGALLDAARERAEDGWRGLDEKLGNLISGDDANGVRGLVLALGLHSSAPWETVAGFCRNEAVAAGIVKVKGRLSRKPVIADRAALDLLRARDAEIVAGRAAYRQSRPELDDCMLGDCFAAVHWAHGTPN